jgi:hypothetical protein
MSRPWTEQCKIEACINIKKRATEGVSIQQAMRDAATESGIPYDTLNRWYYPRTGDVTDDVKEETTLRDEMTQEQHFKVVMGAIRRYLKDSTRAEKLLRDSPDRDYAPLMPELKLSPAQEASMERLKGYAIRENMREEFLRVRKLFRTLIQINIALGWQLDGETIKTDLASLFGEVVQVEEGSE